LNWILPSKSTLCGSTKATDVVVQSDELAPNELLHGGKTIVNLCLHKGLGTVGTLLIEKDALQNCTMSGSTNSRGNTSETISLPTALCHLVNAKVTVDGVDM